MHAYTFMSSGATATLACQSVVEEGDNFALTSPCSGLENTLAECRYTTTVNPKRDCKKNTCTGNNRQHARLTCITGNVSSKL